MEGNSSRPSLKRRFSEDEYGDSVKPTSQKRVRFPKGKKVKLGDALFVDKGKAEESPVEDPRHAAKERAKRRNQMTADLFSEGNRGLANDISAAEVIYEDNENLDADGIQLEPFNLDEEKEEGYFDEAGNYVEYVNDNEIKDAWLDSVDVGPKYTGKTPIIINNEDDVQELSSEEVGKIKRRIADVLEPGETVLQALRRLKGNSNDRKEKMSAEIKHIFDKLTEDAMKLMDNGEYNVYHEKQEVFEREAGAVLEAKAQLVGIHERVRSDVENNQSSNPSISNTTQEGKRVASAANPNPADAAELLRMCLHCGIPKTFSNARGMFCPLCGDRPPEPEPDSESKKKGSTVKDKEKVKRMRGQSSHATWKTESEMQLRQQFD